MSWRLLLDPDWYDRHFDRLLLCVFAGGIALLLASTLTGRGGDVIVGDAADYFEDARSLVADGRFPAHHIKYPIGVALIGMVVYAPVTWIGNALGVHSSRWTAGTALVQQIAYCVPFLVLAWIAFRANAATLVRLGFSRPVVRMMVLFWIVATNVGFYILKEPALSESGTYAFLSLYYWALIRWFYVPPGATSETDGWIRPALYTGLFLGIAGMIRQQNILHAVAMPLLLWSQRRESGIGNRESGRLRALVLTATVSAVLFVVPWMAWYVINGRLVLFSYGEEHFNFASPHPLDALFHPGYHGLMVWHPAFAIAAIGLVEFFRRRPELRAALITPMAIQFYLISAWYWLSFGTSLGGRGFFTIFPILLYGWVAAGEYFVERRRNGLLIGIAGLLTVSNAVVTLLFITGRIDPFGLPPR